MSKLITKARAGVTLVELLVVVLIVTILSVSLLPLLKPFVVEAQYAAEAIPVIGNLRTKISMYQYEHGPLPSICSAGTGRNYGATIETWGFSQNGTSIDMTKETDLFVPGWTTLGAGGTGYTAPAAPTACSGQAEKTGNFGYLIDVDNQELVGKRCKPVHFQYAVISNNATYCYAIGCFGDDHGLPKGTGYAVCEINVKSGDNVYKQIGTWKRYKAASDGQISFATIAQTDNNTSETVKKTCAFCALPNAAAMGDPQASNGTLKMVQAMESYGWEF